MAAVMPVSALFYTLTETGGEFMTTGCLRFANKLSLLSFLFCLENVTRGWYWVNIH
jgi:hypothetical protein